MRENVIHQQSSAVSHPPRPATGAKTPAFATECHQLLIMAGLTANSQETMLQPAALQILIKFAANECGQVFALARQFGLELRPVLTDDVVEQGGLGAVAYVSCGRRWWYEGRWISGRARRLPWSMSFVRMQGGRSNKYGQCSYVVVALTMALFSNQRRKVLFA